MIKIYSLLGALLLSTFCYAQNSYSFSVTNEAYVNLLNSTSLNDGEVWDDPAYTIPVGFDFTIGPNTFDTFYIVEDGAGAILSNITTIDPGVGSFMVPVIQDIVDLGIISGVSMSNISYVIEGVSGDRIFKLEYNNVGFFEDSTNSDSINFQIWLYENQNIIEYRYGPFQINNPDESYQFQPGLGIGLFPSVDNNNDVLLETAYVLNNSPTNPDFTAYQQGEEVDEYSIFGDVPNGTVYRFTPGTLGVSDNALSVFNIIPNPATDTFSINKTLTLDSIKLFNELGQFIISFNPLESSYNIEAFPSGIYFLEIQTKEGVQTKKLIKK